MIAFFLVSKVGRSLNASPSLSIAQAQRYYMPLSLSINSLFNVFVQNTSYPIKFLYLSNQNIGWSSTQTNLEKILNLQITVYISQETLKC